MPLLFKLLSPLSIVPLWESHFLDFDFKRVQVCAECQELLKSMKQNWGEVEMPEGIGKGGKWKPFILVLHRSEAPHISYGLLYICISQQKKVKVFQ